MFRTVGDQPSLFESVLPEQLLRLPEELARVDALLDDPAFFAPFVPFFDPRIGRPSTPMETYLRMMFLKFRYRLGYESLCREVSDSIAWRRFCRIPLEGSVPNPTTLMKLTTRCGPTAVEGLNEALLAKAAAAKLLRTNRVRVDTTVVPSNVSYPTDSGLLAKAITRIAATQRRIQAAGGATRTKVRDRSRAAGKRAHSIGAKLRTRSAAGKDEAQAAVRRVTSELADLAQTVAKDADRVLANAKQALRRARAKAKDRPANGERDAAAGRRRGRLARAVNDLTELVGATRKIAAQTRQRLAGTTPQGATRRVSLHDPDARPIAKGRLGQTGRVRPQGPAGRQRRRRRSRLHRRARQPGRRAAARPRGRTDRPPYRPDAPRRHRRSRLRRAEGRRHPPRAGCAHRGDPPQRQTGQGPTGRGTPTDVPKNREVANRHRRQDQHPQTRLRMGPNPHRRNRRSQDLDRPRSPGPQPDQDQRPRRLT